MLPSSLRFTPLSLALIATLAALAGTAGSAQAVAPCPEGQDYTPGNKLCLKTTHSPDSDNPLTDFVSQNSLVTYRVEVLNPGPATATKVVLRLELDRRDPPQLNVRRLTFDTTSLPPDCTAPPDAPAPNVVTCSLGSVKPGAVTRSINVRTPATAAFTSSVASVSADARASDKGNNPDDPTVEDFEDTPEPVEVRVVDGQSISSVPDGVLVTLDTNPVGPVADGDDPRTATFRLRAVGFSSTASITDSVPDNTFVCPQNLKCPGGGWTEAFIPGPDGLKDPFDPPGTMQVELRYDSSSLPPGFSVAKYAMLHDADYNDPDTGKLEVIRDLCAPNLKPPCLDGVPFFTPDGDFVARAFVTGNWRFR